MFDVGVETVAETAPRLRRQMSHINSVHFIGDNNIACFEADAATTSILIGHICTFQR